MSKQSTMWEIGTKDEPGRKELAAMRIKKKNVDIRYAVVEYTDSPSFGGGYWLELRGAGSTRRTYLSPFLTQAQAYGLIFQEALGDGGLT